MLVGERIRLFPTKEQEKLFYKFSNTARFAYNECLAYKIKCYEEEDYSCTVQDLIEHIQDLKYTDEYSWIKDTPEVVTKVAIKDLDKAYRQFFKRGNKGFPKFKKKSKCKLSFYVRTDRFKQLDAKHIKITGIKTPIRIKPHGNMPHLINARISFDNKFWYLSYAYEYNESELVTSGDIIGIDLGIKSLAVTSKGVVYENINKSKYVKKLEKRKQHLQCKLSKKYEQNRDGKKYVKTKNILKLEQEIRLMHRKLRNIRDTHIHTVTMDIVRTKPYAVVIEDLNVSGMLKNKHLSKSIQQQEFYKFRQYLTYKCKAYGSRLIVADRFYSSSKTCSKCRVVKKFLSLSERTYVCSNCGNEIDRDLNAAINLKKLGESKLLHIES